MEYTSTHGCQNGWMGYDEEYRPIPCYICRPNLAKPAQVNDCGTENQPLRRHPVEDAWAEAIQIEFADDNRGLKLSEMPTPTSLDRGRLLVETSSVPWTGALQTRAEALAQRINAKIGEVAVTSIHVTAPAPATPRSSDAQRARHAGT